MWYILKNWWYIVQDRWRWYFLELFWINSIALTSPFQEDIFWLYVPVYILLAQNITCLFYASLFLYLIFYLDFQQRKESYQDCMKSTFNIWGQGKYTTNIFWCRNYFLLFWDHFIIITMGFPFNLFSRFIIIMV